MAVVELKQYYEQTGVTSSNLSDSVKVEPDAPVSIVCNLTSGSPATGVIVQYTASPYDDIDAGTARWINSPLGSRIASGGETILPPFTGLKVVVTDGTWAIQYRQHRTRNTPTWKAE